MKKFLTLIICLSAFGCVKHHMTLGDTCNMLTTATCQRGVECGLVKNLDACKVAFNLTCCGNDNTCDKLAKPDVRAFAFACSAAIKTWSCDEMAQANVPDACASPTVDNDEHL